ncbi:BtrH N-terminal domain-containing protein [Streptacidiphilus sp. P02-A3a]|uniref:BtrH N-terminal domain-containing protein n=1 Tax=Streptacidiphilus sp. P02-A3a TaxID=2704468 RepID=UPI0015FDE66A|nr:BtrH N-terminal domain-containing protein [Streptacidiphilus sp. P02-A3a]QMU69788.1 BtrH N-terminal domain-containing protein [Streptacidiphilus sp. P02-A3a]
MSGPDGLSGLDDLDDGLPVGHLDCSTSTYSRMLRGLGLDARVLGDDLGYRYLARRDVWPIESMLTSGRTHEEAIHSWYGIRARQLHHPGPQAAWDHIRAVVDDGRTAVVSIDLHDWPRSSFRNLRHYPHRVVVAGHRHDQALILDGRGDRRLIQWMPMADISAAMASPGLLSADGTYDGRHVTVDLPYPDPHRPPPPSQRYAQALTGAVARYLHPADTGEPTGWTAMEAFCQDLNSYARALSELPDERTIPGITFFGSLATQRLFNALLTELAGEQTGTDLTACAEAFREAAAAWQRCYHVLLFGFHAGRDMAGLLQRVSVRVTERALKERSLIEQIDRTLRRNGLMELKGPPA